MRERPIIFSGEMVRAILKGKKSQTRRVIKPQPEAPVVALFWDTSDDGTEGWWYQTPITFENLTYNERRPVGGNGKCPLSGDQLWVRETWATDFEWDALPPRIVPQHSPVWWRESGQKKRRKKSVRDVMGKWRPSIFMPRWASRLTLEVTGVRIERVQDISREDAIAEGVGIDGLQKKLGTNLIHARDIFVALWDSINAKRGFGWDRNPWVFVVSFKVL